MLRKRYLEDDLFPKKGAVKHGEAQMPYFYSKEHNELLNNTVKSGSRHEDKKLGVYYVLPTTSTFKGGVEKMFGKGSGMYGKIDTKRQWWSGWRWGFVQGFFSVIVVSFLIGVAKGIWISAGY